jgi:hypothetical protein
MRGTWAEATPEQVDEFLVPWIAKLRVAQGHSPENVKGHVRREDAQIDQTASSASHVPACSISFDSLEAARKERNLVKLGNNLAGAWEALNEDPPFLWRAKQLLRYAGECLQDQLPEGHQVGHLRAFADAVRVGLRVPYHSPQECPKCRPSTSNHSYPRHPMNNMKPLSNPADKHDAQSPNGIAEQQPSAQSNRLAEQEVVILPVGVRPSELVGVGKYDLLGPSQPNVKNEK